MEAEDALSTADTLHSMKLEIYRIGGWKFGRDLYQEVWRKSLLKNSSSGWSHPQILRIARNALIDMQRGETRRSLRLRLVAREEARTGEDAQGAIDEIDERDWVRVESTKLSPPLRAVVEAQLLGMDDRQTATSLSIPVETVRTRRKRGWQQLAKRRNEKCALKEVPGSSVASARRS
jgi:DNA-directed RNA polymerase specialized sigma24 family protein